VVKYKPTAEDADRFKLEGKEASLRGYLKTLYPDPDAQAPEIGTLQMRELLSRIEIRERELMDQFPIGTFVTFMSGDKEVSGIVSQFVPDNDRLGTGVAIKGVRGGFSLAVLANASIAPERFDPTIVEVNELRERVSERVRKNLEDKPVDLARETGRMTTAIMRVLTKGKGTDLESIPDDQIDREIEDHQFRN